MPIASTITHVFGWRAAFITIFVATLALLALLFMKLPRQNRLKAGSILEQFKLFLDKRISIGCAKMCIRDRALPVTVPASV